MKRLQQGSNQSIIYVVVLLLMLIAGCPAVMAGHNNDVVAIGSGPSRRQQRLRQTVLVRSGSSLAGINDNEGLPTVASDPKSTKRIHVGVSDSLVFQRLTAKAYEHRRKSSQHKRATDQLTKNARRRRMRNVSTVATAESDKQSSASKLTSTMDTSLANVVPTLRNKDKKTIRLATKPKIRRAPLPISIGSYRNRHKQHHQSNKTKGHHHGRNTRRITKKVSSIVSQRHITERKTRRLQATLRIQKRVQQIMERRKRAKLSRLRPLSNDKKRTLLVGSVSSRRRSSSSANNARAFAQRRGPHGRKLGIGIYFSADGRPIAEVRRLSSKPGTASRSGSRSSHPLLQARDGGSRSGATVDVVEVLPPLPDSGISRVDLVLQFADSTPGRPIKIVQRKNKNDNLDVNTNDPLQLTFSTSQTTRKYRDSSLSLPDFFRIGDMSMRKVKQQGVLVNGALYTIGAQYLGRSNNDIAVQAVSNSRLIFYPAIRFLLENRFAKPLADYDHPTHQHGRRLLKATLYTLPMHFSPGSTWDVFYLDSLRNGLVVVRAQKSGSHTFSTFVEDNCNALPRKNPTAPNPCLFALCTLIRIVESKEIASKPQFFGAIPSVCE